MSKKTKDIILKTTLKLFAKNGYGGTSVRKIAYVANVNVAAINYHFSSKEKLLQEVIIETNNEMEILVSKLFDEMSDCSLSEFVYGLSQCFNKKGEAVVAIYRLILGEKVKFPKIKLFDQKQMGPPGLNYLLQKIKEEVGIKVSYELLHWAALSIFSHVVYSTLMISSEFGKQQLISTPYFNEGYRRRDLSLFTDAIIEKLKSEI